MKKNINKIGMCIALLSTLALNASERELKPFLWNGCNILPEYALGLNELSKCCYNHDIAYFVGGDNETRLLSDMALGDCISMNAEEDLGALRINGKEFVDLNLSTIVELATTTRGGVTSWASKWEGRTKANRYDMLTPAQWDKVQVRLTQWTQMLEQNINDIEN